MVWWVSGVVGEWCGGWVGEQCGGWGGVPWAILACCTIGVVGACAYISMAYSVCICPYSVCTYVHV